MAIWKSNETMVQIMEISVSIFEDLALRRLAPNFKLCKELRESKPKALVTNQTRIITTEIHSLFDVRQILTRSLNFTF
jgi:hypothetical protein